MTKTPIQEKISKFHPAVFSLYAIIAAFCTYSCMYAFRKPFTVATFDDMLFWGVNYKTWLLISQVLGYMLSKFIGIKVIAERSGKAGRGKWILILILAAELALLGFGLVPAPWNIPLLFLNGLPLGMVWGLVFSFLEGRQTTEMLGAGLSISFIFSSGFVKSIGKWVMLSGVSEFWMPFVTGLIFVLPLFLFVWMLEQLPPPSEKDIEMRTERAPMGAVERGKFVKTFWPGLIVLVIAYMLLTAFRDFRDNFAAEIWQALGYGESAGIFTKTEIPISLGILILMGSVMFIKNNYRALVVNHLIILAGVTLVGGSTFLFEKKMLGPEGWMILTGMGLYMGYVPYNSIFFDRLIASFRIISNVGFLIYVADAFGYLCSVGVMLFKDFGKPDLSWLDFFIGSGYVMFFVGLICMVISMLYFHQRYANWLRKG